MKQEMANLYPLTLEVMVWWAWPRFVLLNEPDDICPEALWIVGSAFDQSPCRRLASVVLPTKNRSQAVLPTASNLFINTYVPVLNWPRAWGMTVSTNIED